MATNSKRKGNSYELKIAKKMTEWTGLKFERVPASGGLHWAADNRVYGDIVCNVPDFPFVIEVKCRESWNMDSLINGSKEVEKWWKQVTADAEATGKQPMVIFTRNRQPDYVMLKVRDYHYQRKLILTGIREGFFMNILINEDELIVMKLEDFISDHKFCMNDEEII